jgi:hypothetical protein
MNITLRNGSVFLEPISLDHESDNHEINRDIHVSIQSESQEDLDHEGDNNESDTHEINRDIHVSIQSESQEDFEQSLRQLLNWLLEGVLNIDNLIFTEGGFFKIPNWFISALQDLGVGISIINPDGSTSLPTIQGITNATWLTCKYPGKEDVLWTPCIRKFFLEKKPILPVSACIDSLTNGPRYTARMRSRYLHVDGKLLPPNCGPGVFLPKISARFGLNLGIHPGRYRIVNGNNYDIAGLVFDMVLIKPGQQGIVIMENKPYYESTLTFNQGVGGDYIRFVRWLDRLNIPCEYIIICSTSWNVDLKPIQDELTLNCFGLVFIEDIFSAMAGYKFRYPSIHEPWSLFTNKAPDYISWKDYIALYP